MRTSSILLAFVSVFALVGCVSGGESTPVVTGTPTASPTPDAKELVSTALDETAATSYRFEMEMLMEGIPQAPPITMLMDGAVDEVARLMSLRTDATEIMGDLGRYDMLLSDELVYLRGGPFGTLADTEWVSADAAVLSQYGGDPFASQNPAQQLELMSRAGDLAEAGRDVVRGVPATRWNGTVDLANGTPEERQRVESAIADLGATLDDVSTYDTSVWIDDDGYIRRLTIRYSIAAPGFGPGISIDYTLTYEMFEFGAPITFTLPADEDVTDVTFQIALALGQG
ncbi:MAG: hypothetical protein KC472_06905 [Dehalococcoidia bacterium]|nr:hypothetical protein [Dehalococcoidia bacterium]